MAEQFLVATWKHGLTPFANRLRNEGQEVEILVWKPRYERAWTGKFSSLARHPDGPPSAEALKTIQKSLDTGQITLLSDFPHELPLQAENSYVMGPQDAESPLRLGTWISSDGTLTAPHLMIYDPGTWPGGMGLWKSGGATIVHLEGAAPLARELLAELNLDGLRGLLEVDIKATPDGDLELGALNAGWNWLQSHAFLAGLENFGAVLTGAEPAYPEGHKFSTVIPVSVPPWPEYGRPADEVEIGPLAPQVRSQIYWHDMTLDLENKGLRTAGLDGLVGVAHGSGSQPGVALQRAWAVANAVVVPQKQWRPDVGQTVQQVLEAFELHFELKL